MLLPQQPQSPGLGGFPQPPQATGIMSNPLFMGGMMGLTSSLGGGNPAAGMAAGIHAANQYQQNAWGQQMQALQMQKLQRDLERQERQEAALRSLGGNEAFAGQLGDLAGVWGSLPSSIQGQVAAGLFGKQLEQQFRQARTYQDVNGRTRYMDGPKAGELVGPEVEKEVTANWQADPTGRLYNTRTGDYKDGGGQAQPGLTAPKLNNPNTGWSVDTIRSEFKLDQYSPESVAAALAAQDPSLLQATGEPVKPADQLKFANFAKNNLAVFDEVQGAVDQIYALLPGEGGPEQLAALIQYAKALDPGSVVREGEVALQRQSAGLIGSIETMIDRATKEQGGILSSGQKESIASAVKKIQALNKKRYAMHRAHAEDLFAELNMNPKLLPPKLTAFSEEPAPGAFTGAAAGGTPPPAATQVYSAPEITAMAQFDIDPDSPDALRQLRDKLREQEQAAAGPPAPPAAAVTVPGMAPGMGGPGGIWAR